MHFIRVAEPETMPIFWPVGVGQLRLHLLGKQKRKAFSCDKHELGSIYKDECIICNYEYVPMYYDPQHFY